MTIDITKITPEKLAEMNDTLMVDNTHLRDTVANLRKQVAIARENLHKLSCLGNGDQLGNSEGNCIAQDALDDMDMV